LKQYPEVVSDIEEILVKFNLKQPILSNQDTNLQLDFSDALMSEEINGNIKFGGSRNACKCKCY
jgi:hypothetical protein